MVMEHFLILHKTKILYKNSATISSRHRVEKIAMIKNQSTITDEYFLFFEYFSYYAHGVG